MYPVTSDFRDAIVSCDQAAVIKATVVLDGSELGDLPVTSGSVDCDGTRDGALRSLALTLSPDPRAYDWLAAAGAEIVVKRGLRGLAPPAAAPAFSATGGIVSYDGDYTVHKFTANDTLVCSGSIEAEVLVVAGGGGGNTSGAAAGGYLDGAETLTGNMAVTVGNGGVGGATPANGGDSIFGTRHCYGGGKGVSNGNGVAGGSGSGASGNGNGTGGAASPSGQGNAGGDVTAPGGLWPGAGGGGIGAKGGSNPNTSTGGPGGAGVNNDIVQRGTNVGYAGGGGASAYSTGGTGGTASHGGGAGNGAGTGTAGTDGTGGGGGGGCYSAGTPGCKGGTGGKGIVVVRYPTPVPTVPDEELVPLGVFVLDADLEEAEDGTLTVSAADRSRRISRARWTDPYIVAAGLNVGDALADLLTTCWVDCPIGSTLTTIDKVTGAKAVYLDGADSDPWKDARELAASSGHDLYFDAEGVVQVRDTPDPQSDPVCFTYYAGDEGVVLSRTRTLKLSQLYNGVIATAEGSGVAAPKRGEAWDDDPNSPTYCDGPMGRVPLFYSSPVLTTQGDVDSASVTRLARVKRPVEQVTFTLLPNPAHEAFDVVEFVDENDVARRYMFDIVSIPLDSQGTLTATTRETEVV